MTVRAMPPPPDQSVYCFGDYVIRCKMGSRLDKKCQELKKQYPNLKMRHKRNVLKWRIVHWIIVIFTLGFNRKFLSDYTTTSKDCVDWGDGHHERITKMSDLDRVWACLEHEAEHLRQFAKYGTIMMAINYVFVILPLFAAIGRTYTEKPGYIKTLRAWYALDHNWPHSPEARKWWVGQFTSSSYGWMALVIWWLPSRWYDKELKRLTSGVLGA